MWLPKKTLIPRVATETDSYSKGSKNMAAEQAALALQQAADENFDYKDFNFIVGKNNHTPNVPDVRQTMRQCNMCFTVRIKMHHCSGPRA